MVHSDKIHRWLSQPGKLPHTEQDVIAGLIEKYPYFIPGRYLQAALEQKHTPFAPEMQSRMQLFMGNRLLWHEIMQGTITAQEPQPGAGVSPEGISLIQTTEEVPAVADLPTDDQSAMEDFMDADKAASGDISSKLHAAQVGTGNAQAEADDMLQLSIPPVYSEDYFLHQGVHVSGDIPEDQPIETPPDPKDKSLLVVMSFSEWLMHFKSKTEKEKEEEEGQKALRTMWQKEKMAAALEDENDEIPENVFTMAVNSISREDEMISEPLAGILIRQGKHDKAIEMYRKLSLRNPQKSTYFAGLIEKIQKEKES